VNRRDLIALLGSTAVAWPLGARAQQPERMRRIGVLTNIAEDDLEARARIAAFKSSLHELGWGEGRNLLIETRLTLGNADLTRKYASELVGLSPDVIVAVGTEVTSALALAVRARMGPVAYLRCITEG
jgi:putative ABC transport system substrate-binding protein